RRRPASSTSPWRCRKPAPSASRRARAEPPMRSPAAPLLTALLLSLLAGCSALPPPGPEDFRVYRGDGSPASLEDVLSALRAVDVGFLGESHDDAVGHALEV